MSTPLSNEQKLDEIYDMLRTQENARRRALWWGLFRRAVFYGLIIFIATNPTFFIEKAMEIMKPMISKTIDEMMTSQKDTLMKNIKEMMPAQN
jgi:predicted tellurium resistance membrane protein TerC